MPEFTDKKAVVTGATRGIGRAVTEALLEQGAMVVGLYSGDEQAAANLRDEAARFASRLRLTRLDVSDYPAAARFFAAFEEEFDTLDILVNNAGIRRDAVLALMKEEEWRRVIDVNLTGGFITSRLALPLMLKQKYGRIIFITSPMGRMGFPGQANYAASKAGQVAMARSLCQEVAKRKITVNCVSPGFIATDFIGDLDETRMKEYKKMVPSGRFGTPQEVAQAVLFLAGSEAAYINGAVLEITGGL
ncbi:MAG: SDR family oxidoreductase [Desulfobulbaceae bacterium]|jgi:3-oxoacyl-[acyl-carrier protein] reductase|nr:SDR family oxidoreductase [Desulfobulbaceae bacterium]